MLSVTLASLRVSVGVTLSALLMGAAQAPSEEPDAGASDEIRRTKPDFVLYDPTGGKPPRGVMQISSG